MARTVGACEWVVFFAGAVVAGKDVTLEVTTPWSIAQRALDHGRARRVVVVFGLFGVHAAVLNARRPLEVFKR